jgi:ComF family protein
MLRRFKDGLLNLVYPKSCLACKDRMKTSSQDELICGRCWGNIKRNLPPFCHSCGRQLDKKNFSKNICPACQKVRLHFDRAFSPFIYTGAIKELIHEFKYKNKDYLGAVLSKPMIEFIKEYSLPMDFLDFIIPMPLSEAKMREREFNQAEVLSRHIADEFKKCVFSDILVRHRNTKTQTELEINERFLNVKGSFAVTRHADIKGKNLLLVDDVLTTGATSSEAALTLKKAGANVVFVLTLAN